jgi:hypothetical protein
VENLYIDLGETDIEFFTSCDKSIYICVGYENTSNKKEISRETLKSYIDKLQEMYESTQC